MARPSKAYQPVLRSYPRSCKVNEVSVGAEMLYLRLLVLADSNGAFWGSPSMVASMALAERLERGSVTVENVAVWLEELGRAGLLLAYVADEREYVALQNYYQVSNLNRTDVRFPALLEHSSPLGPHSVPTMGTAGPHSGDKRSPTKVCETETETEKEKEKEKETERESEGEGATAPGASGATTTQARPRKPQDYDRWADIVQEAEFEPLQASAEFADAMRANMQMRKEHSKHKALTPTAIRIRLRQALQIGVTEYTAAIIRCTGGESNGVNPDWYGSQNGREAPKKKSAGQLYMEREAAKERQGHADQF